METYSSPESHLLVIDAFCGPGGLSLGFKQAGFTIALGIESDLDATDTYQSNFPDTEVLPDEIENVTGDDVQDSLHRFKGKRKVILVGGPPCQPFSNANMHKDNRGKDHPFASSIDHFARLLKEILPDAFLFENVTAFESIGGGRSLKLLVESAEKLGYVVSDSELEAHRFSVPQHRRRFFLGGMRSQQGFTLPSSHPHEAVLNGTAVKGLVTVREAISDLPNLPKGGGGTDEVDYPTYDSSTLCSYQEASRLGSRKIFNHCSTCHSEEVRDTMRLIDHGSSLSKAWKRLPKKIRDRYAKGPNIQENIYYRLRWDRVSPTIVHPRRAMLLHPKIRQSRILSVREAARLQSFPDKFRFRGGLDSQYQQVANAVPPRLAKALASLYKRNLTLRS